MAAAGDEPERAGPGGDRVTRLSGDPPSPWEQQFGYSRVVIAGGFALLGGVTSVGPGGMIIGQTPYEQTIEILGRVLHEFSRAGVMPEDIVATRFLVTDISRAEEVGRAFGEILGSIAPLMTMLEVSALIDPRMFVEVEATALAPPSGSQAPGAG
jgi:enamine deaminase RidA (YjgF/YER057c/UK114 family)